MSTLSQIIIMIKDNLRKRCNAFTSLQKYIKKNQIFIITILCVMLGAIERIIYCLNYPVPVRDACKYQDLIKRWIETDKITSDMGIPPLSLFIFKIFSNYFKCSIIDGGIIINILIGLLIICILIYISYYKCSSCLLSLFIGILSASHPTLIDYSCQMTRENIYLFLCCLTFLFIIVYYKKKHLYAVVLFSITSAMAYLCRHEALELVAIGILSILFLRKRKKVIKDIGVYIISYVCTFIIMSIVMGIPFNYYKKYYIITDILQLANN